jgi:hypothetical protein
MRSICNLFYLVTLLLVSGCTSLAGSGPQRTVSLPLHFAWMDGRQVEYVTTDISDQTMAQMLGVNYVPRLAGAVPVQGSRSLVERVYKFADDTQITVFQSAPSPTGPSNADLAYSPLWRMVLVRWNQGHPARELKSEEQILRAVDANELALELTGIVINCPITRSIDGIPIRGAQ